MMALWMKEDAHYPMPGGYGKTPAERLDILREREEWKPTLEVSTHGRVRFDGKLLCKESNGKFGRVKWKGKRYDVARVVRRAVHGPSGKPDWTDRVLFPRTTDWRFELWFPVSRLQEV